MEFSQLDPHMIITFFPPRELYFIRLVNIFFNKLITDEMINTRIIQLIHTRLEKIIGKKYYEFVKFLEKMEITIYGNFITQCILNEYWNDYRINLTMNSDNIPIQDNLFAQYKSIDDRVTTDADIKYNEAIKFLMASNNLYILNDYEEKKYNKLALDFDYNICDNEPDIFMNSFNVIDGKIILYVKNIKKIMCKKETFDFCPEQWLDTFADHIEKCTNNGFDCYIKPLITAIQCDYHNIELLVYRESDGDFILYGQHYKTLVNGRIACNPIKIINDSEHSFVYINTKLKEFTKDCEMNCPLCVINKIDHYRSCKYVGFKKEFQQVGYIIVVKYSDIPELSYYTEKFKEPYLEPGEYILDYSKHKIKPSFLLSYPSKEYIGTFSINYSEMFNDTFDGFNNNATSYE